MENPTQSPVVSIIVATLNAASTLQRCIDSVKDQTWLHKELIVCDGGSLDRTIEIIEKNRGALAHWLSERDDGVYDAWNKGIGHCQGDWICFLGADDYFFSPDALDRMIGAAAAAYPGIRVVYGSVALVSEPDKVLSVIGRPWQEVRERFKQLMCIPHPGLLCHRSVFEEHGLFDASYRVAGDYEFLLRELTSREAHFVSGEAVVGMQVGGMSSRSRVARIALAEVRRAQKAHGLPTLGRHWVAAYARAQIRRLGATLIGERFTDRLVNSLRRKRA